MAKPTKAQIEAMKKIGLSDEEIADIIESDNAIDRGKEVYFDLTPEQEKVAKKMTKTGTKAPTVYNLDNEKGKRSKKENIVKSTIIAELGKFLEENPALNCKNVEITNKEKLILFKIGENTFELDLKQKRKPKN